MIHTNQSFGERVEAAVAEVEEKTDAELVVVASPRSGSYRDVSMAVGSLLTWLLIVGLLFVEWTIHPVAFVFEIGVSWLVLSWLADSQLVLRYLVPAGRKRAQVELAAAAEFHREAVHSTPNRTGLLIYVSALEGHVEVIADAGLERRVPRGEWARAAEAFRHDDLDHFVEGLRAVGEVLATHVPPTGSGFDLPNAPRIR